jgi:dTDP-4-amino-4,6-dideoxygalactose transaminase
MIHFNVPPITGNEVTYITEAINSHKICGDGNFTKKCNEWFECYSLVYLNQNPQFFSKLNKVWDILI